MITVNISVSHLINELCKSHMHKEIKENHNEKAKLNKDDKALLIVIRAILPDLISESLTKQRTEITSDKFREIHGVLIILSNAQKKTEHKRTKYESK